jgi:hypothetical protein
METSDNAIVNNKPNLFLYYPILQIASIGSNVNSLSGVGIA